jgi:ribosomal protein L7/L12
LASDYSRRAVSAVQARSGQRTNSAGGGSVDIRILAFHGPPARTLRGLQEIFGVDLGTAQRIFDNVPGVVRRGAPFEEAQSYVAALQSIGAQVTLEPTPSGPGLSVPAGMGRPQPQASRRPPQPSIAANDSDPDAWPELENVLRDPDAPRPHERAPSSDLEFDVLSAEDLEEDVVGVAPLRAAHAQEFDGYQDDRTGGRYGEPMRGLGEPAGMGEPRGEFADFDDQRSGASEPSAVASREHNTVSMRRDELDLSGAGGGMLDVDASAKQRAPTARPAARIGTGNPELRPAGGRTATGGMRRPSIAAPTSGTGGARTTTGKAAVLEHPEKAPARPRARALLSLLAACAVAAIGVVFDNSIFFGNASWFSVVAHGLALHQLGLAVWGLLR